MNQRAGSPAETGLKYLNKLFELEEEFRELSPIQRSEARLDRSKQVSDEFFAWNGDLASKPNIAASENLLAKAVRYAISQRQYLENIYLDGRLELSNNRAEQTFARFAVGRNNWLNANTITGAEANAIHYSVVLTAMLNGLHPRKCIQFILEKLTTAKVSELPDFLPWSDNLPASLKVR